MITILESKNKWNFKYVEEEYTGGGISIFYGQLADGTYFLGVDDMYDVRLLDSDPQVKDENEMYGVYISDDPAWQEEHLVRDLNTETESPDFWLALYNFCKKNNSITSDYDINRHINELRNLKKTPGWR